MSAKSSLQQFVLTMLVVQEEKCAKHQFYTNSMHLLDPVAMLSAVASFNTEYLCQFKFFKYSHDLSVMSSIHVSILHHHLFFCEGKISAVCSYLFTLIPKLKKSMRFPTFVKKKIFNQQRKQITITV